MIKCLLIFILIFQSFLLNSAAVTPLPFGFSALIYDVNYPAGPGSHGTNDPGQWVSQITTYNSGALAENQYNQLNPYSSDIEITCPNPNDTNTCSILPGYATGNASVAAYSAAFPNAKILPIVDIAFNYLNNNLLKTNISLADTVAQNLVTQICNDPLAAGVFLDIETKNVLSNKGLFRFFSQVSTLFKSSQCVSSTYPNGRVMGMYLTPNEKDWGLAAAMFGSNNNSYLAIPLYDLKAFTTPPTPDPLKLYNSYVTKSMTNANTFGMKNKVPYMIIVPASASFGTFEKTGLYNASEPAPTYFQLITDYSTSNATQLAFVQNARNAACAHKNPYYMGMTSWAYLQYIAPGKNASGDWELNMPNIPDTSTVAYLQQSATCK
ncbi:MAG: hypothetical protein P1U74_03970 [Legionellaceae bacterium]|nr:hypothetical protein [Legionellaceae bacterium]